MIRDQDIADNNIFFPSLAWTAAFRPPAAAAAVLRAALVFSRDDDETAPPVRCIVWHRKHTLSLGSRTVLDKLESSELLLRPGCRGRRGAGCGGHHRPSSVRKDHVIKSALDDGNKKNQLVA